MSALCVVWDIHYPPKVYTQNANECMNRLIKAEDNSNYSKKESSLLPYVERIRSEIQRQQDDFWQFSEEANTSKQRSFHF
jgi:hypothetical protein